MSQAFEELSQNREQEPFSEEFDDDAMISDAAWGSLDLALLTQPSIQAPPPRVNDQQNAFGNTAADPAHLHAQQCDRLTHEKSHMDVVATKPSSPATACDPINTSLCVSTVDSPQGAGAVETSAATTRSSSASESDDEEEMAALFAAERAADRLGVVPGVAPSVAPISVVTPDSGVADSVLPAKISLPASAPVAVHQKTSAQDTQLDGTEATSTERLGASSLGDEAPTHAVAEEGMMAGAAAAKDRRAQAADPFSLLGERYVPRNQCRLYDPVLVLEGKKTGQVAVKWESSEISPEITLAPGFGEVGAGRVNRYEKRAPKGDLENRTGIVYFTAAALKSARAAARKAAEKDGIDAQEGDYALYFDMFSGGFHEEGRALCRSKDAQGVQRQFYYEKDELRRHLRDYCCTEPFKLHLTADDRLESVEMLSRGQIVEDQERRQQAYQEQQKSEERARWESEALSLPPVQVCCLCTKEDGGEYGSLLEFPVFKDQKSSVHKDGRAPDLAHYCCAYFAQATSSGGRDEHYGLKQASKEFNRGKHLPCVYCQKKGATMGCWVKDCTFYYHFPCANKATNVSVVRGDPSRSRPLKGDGYGDLYCPVHYNQRKKDSEQSLADAIEQHGDPGLIEATAGGIAPRKDSYGWLQDAIRDATPATVTDEELPASTWASVVAASQMLLRVHVEKDEIEKTTWEEALEDNRGRAEKRKEKQKKENNSRIAAQLSDQGEDQPIGAAVRAAAGMPQKKPSRLKLRKHDARREALPGPPSALPGAPKTKSEEEKQLAAALALSRRDSEPHSQAASLLVGATVPRQDPAADVFDERSGSGEESEENDDADDDSEEEWTEAAENTARAVEEMEQEELEGAVEPDLSMAKSTGKRSATDSKQASIVGEGVTQLERQHKKSKATDAANVPIKPKKKSKNVVSSSANVPIEPKKKSKNAVSNSAERVASTLPRLASTVASAMPSARVELSVRVARKRSQPIAIGSSEDEDDDDENESASTGGLKSTAPSVVADSEPIVYEDAAGRDTYQPQGARERAGSTRGRQLIDADWPRASDPVVEQLEARALAKQKAEANRAPREAAAAAAGRITAENEKNIKQRKRIGKCGGCKCCLQNIWRCGDHPRETTQCCAESIISCCRDSEQCLHNHPENGLDQCLVDEEFMDQDDERVDVNDPEADFQEPEELPVTERVRQEQARSKAAERTRQEDSRWKDGQSLAGKRKPSKRQKVKAAGQDAFKRTASANLGGGGASTAGIASVAARSGASSRAAVRDENGRAFESFSALDDAGQQGARRPPPQHVEKTNDQLRREAWARRDVHRENQERVGQFKQAKQDRRQQTQSQKVNEEQRQQAQLLENRRLDLQKERETWERQNERDNMEIERKKQDLANQAKRLEQQEAEKPGMAATQSKCPVCTELAYEPAFLDGHNHTDMICRHCVYQMVDHKDFRCPLCREPFGVDAIRKRLEINRSAWDSIQRVWPVQCSERKVVVEADIAEYEAKMRAKRPVSRPVGRGQASNAPARARDRVGRIMI